MSALEPTAVLEIGTANIRLLVGEMREDGVINVLAMDEVRSHGLRKGEITDRDKVVSAVRHAIKAVEDRLRRSIHAVHLVTAGGEAAAERSMGRHRLVDPLDNRPGEVTPAAVEEAVENARRVALPPHRIRLHSLHRCFHLDDLRNITDPVGLAGEELRAEVLTIHGKRSTVENLRKIIEDVPVECIDAAFSALCSALAVLSEEQKKAGALVIDIGAGTTDMIVFYDGVVQTAASFAVGGDHVTNDIMVGLGVSPTQAERLKINDGSALTNAMERDRIIAVPYEQGFSGKTVRSVTLNTIINLRMEEIFNLVRERMERECPQVPLGAGVLLTGGGSMLSGARDLGQKVFNVPCTRGKLFDVQGVPPQAVPRYAPHIGCLRYVASLRDEEPPPEPWFRRLFRFLTPWRNP